MDLYGSNGQAIAMGNARRQQVREMNERIQQHNTDIANKIAELKSEGKSADKLTEIKATAQSLWTAKDMPGKIKAYNDWRASPSASNPTTNVERTTANAVEERDPMRTGFSGRENAPTGEVSTISESTANAERVAGTSAAGEVAGRTGTQLVDGAKEALSGESKTLLGKVGEKAGILGSAALGGMDIYEDWKDSMKAGKLEIAGNNNWEKAGNVLQIGGSIADVVGNFVPPAKLLGGVLDLASAATDQVGQELDEDKTSEDLKQKQAEETEQTIAAPMAQSITVGNVA